uniref:Thioredoxin domain-containing protein 8 n=1 Tax=Pan troglodytes TaxID=9598 RepID=A0A2I3TQV0_PANTR
MVQIIKDINEFKTFLTAAGHKLAVVQFSSKRCGPCKRMFPVFHAMSVKYQNVFFANVDVNNSPELAETCHIKTIPTFQMFKKSQKVCNPILRIKRIICCYRSGFMSNLIFEILWGRSKIQELM